MTKCNNNIQSSPSVSFCFLAAAVSLPPLALPSLESESSLGWMCGEQTVCVCWSAHAESVQGNKNYHLVFTAKYC